jgi:hypothetical protein
MEAADLNEQVLQEIGFIIQEMDLPPGALAMRCLEVQCMYIPYSVHVFSYYLGALDAGFSSYSYYNDGFSLGYK